ncbi:FG-GAP repeat protein, partial [Opisthorchis viverrini]
VCAPKLTRSIVQSDYVTGGCFQLDANLQDPKAFQSSMSFCQDIPEAAKSIDLRHCTIGATVGHHPRSPNSLFMGGPYFYYAKGMGAILDTEKFSRTQTSRENIPPNTLLGSALDVSDRIFAPQYGPDPPVYVAYGGPGVPVTANEAKDVGTGIVLIYHSSDVDSGTDLNPVIQINGNQFASRFGHAVLLVDINNDGWEDLIVGAPYQEIEAVAGGQPQYGAVFVFTNRQGQFPQPFSHQSGFEPFTYENHQMLFPPDKQECEADSLSGYGATLAELGDINHDGFQDFAVGAPYATGGGMVFVYHGSRTGRIGLPAQVICTPKLATNVPLRGLGFAVGLKGLDLDGNGYADLALGAPLSDAVVVLRTRPIIKFKVHLVLPDGSTRIPSNLDSLPDCTAEASNLPGYMAPKVRCLNTKIFMTYTSVDGKPCKPDVRYRATVLLKSDPPTPWLRELWEEIPAGSEEITTQPKDSTCGSHGFVSLASSTLFHDLSIVPVSFIGERSVKDYADQADRFFTVNRSASSAAVNSPGGYLPIDLEATCRERMEDRSYKYPVELDQGTAKTVRIVFRDTKLVDQTSPVQIGVRWVADLPVPYPTAGVMDQFPISNPRENSQLIKLNFDNDCTVRTCCPRLAVTYEFEVSRDKHGPVVYVGDDKAQTITVKVTVTNIGTDPAFMTSLVSTYPPTLLELDPTLGPGLNVAPNAASCSLANPLIPGESQKCLLRWLVVAHQLTVQMAQFSVNSTIITGAASPVEVHGSPTHELRVNVKMVVNVSVTGTVEPNTVYFSGNASDGIKSISAENQIGDSRLLIKFTVRNLRNHSLIPASRLIVDWPYEIAGDIKESHGKYLLYLLDNPSVVQHQFSIPGEKETNTTSVVCDSRALKRLVNPHNYRIFKFLRPSSDSVPVNLGRVDFPSSHPSAYPPLSPNKMSQEVPGRNEDSDKQQKRLMTTVSCYNGQLRCVPITCDLGKLSHKAGPITLEFIARLWDNTMRQDFKDFFLTKLRLSATWRADVKYGIDLGDADHTQETIELSIFNNLEPKPIVPKYTALYIALAVFGGAVVLAIIVIILKKAGFFKRKRFLRKPKQDNTDASKPLDPAAAKPTTTSASTTQYSRQPAVRTRGYQAGTMSMTSSQAGGPLDEGPVTQPAVSARVFTFEEPSGRFSRRIESAAY